MGLKTIPLDNECTNTRVPTVLDAMVAILSTFVSSLMDERFLRTPFLRMAEKKILVAPLVRG